MYDKVKVTFCETCGIKFNSEVIFEKGKLHCYLDCPKCRRDKSRYLECIEVYKEVYKDSSGD